MKTKMNSGFQETERKENGNEARTEERGKEIRCLITRGEK